MRRDPVDGADRLGVTVSTVSVVGARALLEPDGGARGPRRHRQQNDDEDADTGRRSSPVTVGQRPRRIALDRASPSDQTRNGSSTTTHVASSGGLLPDDLLVGETFAARTIDHDCGVSLFAQSTSPTRCLSTVSRGGRSRSRERGSSRAARSDQPRGRDDSSGEAPSRRVRGSPGEQRWPSSLPACHVAGRDRPRAVASPMPPCRAPGRRRGGNATCSRA